MIHVCQDTFKQEVSYLRKCFVSRSHFVCFHSGHALIPISSSIEALESNLNENLNIDPEKAQG